MADPFLQGPPPGHPGGPAPAGATYDRPVGAAPGDWNIPAAAGEQQPLLAGPGAGYKQSVQSAMAADRHAFVQKVYGILSAQMFLTFAIAWPIVSSDEMWLRDNSWLLYVSYAGLIVMLCCMCCLHDELRKFPANYGFLFLLTSCMAVLVGFASAQYTWQSVALAVGVTGGVFVLLTVYACNTSVDFTGYGPYLFAALCVMSLFGLVMVVMSVMGIDVSWLMLLFDVFGVLLFTFYIIYDTQLILGGKHDEQFSIDDYAFAALALYLDIINLFLHLLSLLGDRK
eukprot:TRINITY_DN2189_c0_g1_i1.p1 TRINITY_DN2189_c0_g1~~TRINITY_DN2189_c0_g1_i1.p1  ORF type:complete len:284 (-),score=64.41 TRINITY_DN2189_c0_g1_i1:49-900(-)